MQPKLPHNRILTLRHPFVESGSTARFSDDGRTPPSTSRRFVDGTTSLEPEQELLQNIPVPRCLQHKMPFSIRFQSSPAAEPRLWIPLANSPSGILRTCLRNREISTHFRRHCVGRAAAMSTHAVRRGLHEPRPALENGTKVLSVTRPMSSASSTSGLDSGPCTSAAAAQHWHASPML